MEFRLLGTLEVRDNDIEITPTAPKPREVLALLALRANRVVRVGELMDELWSEAPPPSALPTVQTYIYKLRKTLNGSGVERLATKPYGYQLNVPSTRIDVFEFQRLFADGRTASEAGEPDRVARLLSEALSLWRGPALPDVPRGDLINAHVARLEAARL